ncbi:DUF1330 domain-containing protein [Acinetobacter sichuanensis]|uniref:DUF1330 domain-containing protein n=1 Tax=Acinetobacter sichuanensis TaxID=2136183 RepID=A0A371YNK0_9GAMM|nr:DUF1330 domain-containing protein [Acinetobacter sichuanensis]RFC83022.1 DUF1330 domain-containing protein [Acinetobacter sichuanensis]
MCVSKGYWIIECQEITDKTSMQKYAHAWTEIANEFNAQVIDGTKSFNFVEGTQKARVFILEFPSNQIAQDCYYSEKYKKAKKLA